MNDEPKKFSEKTPEEIFESMRKAIEHSKVRFSTIDDEMRAMLMARNKSKQITMPNVVWPEGEIKGVKYDKVWIDELKVIEGPHFEPVNVGIDHASGPDVTLLIEVMNDNKVIYTERIKAEIDRMKTEFARIFVAGLGSVGASTTKDFRNLIGSADPNMFDMRDYIEPVQMPDYEPKPKKAQWKTEKKWYKRK